MDNQILAHTKYKLHVSYCFYSEISPESNVWEDWERGWRDIVHSM
ncbi:hypothetical protein C823_007920 [Eubacterium plexicaudatum ASF492]|nr:hypothetical protein C823_007920 [Eubacterium plexicaudatum ASF492]